jgi:hypothetical protein
VVAKAKVTITMKTEAACMGCDWNACIDIETLDLRWTHSCSSLEVIAGDLRATMAVLASTL